MQDRQQMGVSINGGYPKMVGLYRKFPSKMDGLGVPLFQENPKCMVCV